MNEENSSAANFEDEENEEAEEHFRDSPVEINNAQSRARNRTVMLTPEMTGQVRALIQEDSPDDDDFMRPGQIAEKATPVVDPDGTSFGEKLAGAQEIPKGLGLKFGESTNRAATTKFTREELDQVLQPGQEFDLGQLTQTQAPVPEDVSSDFQNTQLSSPSVKSAGEGKFDPLTTLAPSNFDSLINMKRPQTSVPRNDGFQPPLTQSSEPGEMMSRSGQSQVQVEDFVPVQSFGATNPTPTATPMPEMTPPAGKKAAPTTKIVGFLISYDENEFGEVFEIRAGRKLITSRPTDHGEYLLIDDPTVSPLHAILRATKEGKVQVLDQLSEYGTGVIRSGEEDEEIEVSGGLEEVFDGDVIRFGEREFHVCMVGKKG